MKGKPQTDYYTTLSRSMFQRINEVGAKPFLLFQYYLTYQTAPKINPSLKTIALDMGIVDKNGKPQISAVSHLKKVLIDKEWIEEIKGEVFIILGKQKVEKISTISEETSPNAEDEKLRKSQQLESIPDNELRKSQQKVEKISTESLENLNSPYIRNENYKREIEREYRSSSLNTPAHAQGLDQIAATANSPPAKKYQWLELTAEEKRMTLSELIEHLQKLNPTKNVKQIAKKLQKFCRENKMDLHLERLKGWVEGEGTTLSNEEFTAIIGEENTGYINPITGQGLK